MRTAGFRRWSPWTWSPTYDSQRRLTMQEVAETEKTLPCQLLVVAAGFLGPCGYVAEAFGVDTDARQ